LFFGNAGHSVPGRSKPALAEGGAASVFGVAVVEVVTGGGRFVAVVAMDVVVVAAEVDVVTAAAPFPFELREPDDRAACGSRALEVAVVDVDAPVARGAADELVHPAMVSSPIVIASAGVRLVPRTDLFIKPHDGSRRVVRPATAYQLVEFARVDPTYKGVSATIPQPEDRSGMLEMTQTRRG
jgi:hypothetical protein